MASIVLSVRLADFVHSALVRPGRFDRHIAVPLPDVRGRTQILKHHMQNIVTDPGILDCSCYLPPQC